MRKEKENMKYAIAQTSGKQILIKPGQWYDIDFIRNGNVGDFIYLNKILITIFFLEFYIFLR